MNHRTQRALVVSLISVSFVLLSVSSAFARGKRSFRAELSGLEEVAAVSTEASGSFRLRFSRDEQTAAYSLSFQGLSSDVLFAHIHFGNASTNGGVSVWLCTTGAGPAGTPACPQEGEVTGMITADDVVGPEAQGIAAGELAELLEALRAGAAYVNVHSNTFPSGEIRGQVR